MSQPIPRPPSRSERLLRDTLRKDDTLRTVHASCPRSPADDDDDDIFQSAILYRCSSRRSSAASALSHSQPTGFYIPDQNEHASYSTLLRSSSHSGSSRSGHSERKHSPRPTHQEKVEDQSRHHDAPHEAVLRSRLDSVIHSMRIDKDADALESASLPSSFGSTSNSRSHSYESHHTQCTVPEPDPNGCWFERGHRHTFSTPATHARLSSPKRTSTPPRVSSHPPRSPRSPQALGSPPEKKRPKHACPDSPEPWVYAPLPPSPPAFSTPPSKHGGPAVVTFVASPTSIEAHTAHLPTTSPARHSPHSSASFDPEAASLALKELQGYVSFSSVAGLGAPPEEEDRRSTRKPVSSFTLGGKGRLSGLGLGSGKWWIF